MNKNVALSTFNFSSNKSLSSNDAYFVNIKMVIQFKDTNDHVYENNIKVNRIVTHTVVTIRDVRDYNYLPHFLHFPCES